jgi:hypothetical protein
MAGYINDSPGPKQEGTYSPALANHTVESVLHTTRLPTSKVFLDQASTTDVSPWEDPVEWVRADSEYVNSIVEEVSELTGNTEIKLASCTEQFIVYPVSYNDLRAIGTWSHGLV